MDRKEKLALIAAVVMAQYNGKVSPRDALAVADHLLEETEAAVECHITELKRLRCDAAKRGGASRGLISLVGANTQQKKFPPFTERRWRVARRDGH